MKRHWKSMILLLSALLLCGCITLKPFPINPPPVATNIAPSSRLPLHAAIVVPDPMGNKIIQTTRHFNPYGIEMRNETLDRTSMYGGERGLPVGRELAKAADEAFSQVFTKVISLRRLPPPGEYDITVEVRILQVNLTSVIHSGIFNAKQENEASYDYEITVLDSKGVEIFHKRDRTATEKFVIEGAFSGPETYMQRTGATLSKLIASMAKEAGLTTYAAEGVRNYAQQLKQYR